ncbi:MAG: hypothetical protein LBL08_03900 [Candidatus Nomurabacteria bacterium]|jgi:hypothetical protein|nr:hypothetical protein [Candidatus Nomurabacteria bacterium]
MSEKMPPRDPGYRAEQRIEDGDSFLKKKQKFAQWNRAVELMREENPEMYDKYQEADFGDKITLAEIWAQRYEKEGKL